VIRAGDGFRPVITLSLEGRESEAALLWTHARLVLEGLEFRRVTQNRMPGDGPRAIRIDEGIPVHIANCRFLMKDTVHVIAGGPICELRNCEFIGGLAVMYVLQAEGALVVDNCLQAGALVNIQNFAPDPTTVPIRLTRNTMLADLPFYVSLNRLPNVPAAGRKVSPVEVAASANVFDGRRGLFYLNQTRLLNPAALSEPAAAEALVGRLFAWRGQRNLYPTGVPLLACDDAPKPLPSTRDYKSLAAWKAFWATTEVGSLQGCPRFQGGDLRAKAALTPELITPDDFRLRPDSPGYKAGKDGKNLGADVDLVGPGKAYERWKKTPEYEQWLKDSGQVKK
jgi:hypothetical protein